MAKKSLQNIGFYFITDKGLSGKDEAEQVEAAISGGANIVQYRDKESSRETFLKVAAQLKEICDRSNAIFIVNDYVDIARIVDADGVHVGQEDMSFRQVRDMLGDKIIGLTVHNIQEAIDAEEMGADYLGVSPIFATATKKDAGTPSGIRLLTEVRKKVSIPIVAIGGINKENVDMVLQSGANSVCAISATVIGDIAANVNFFVEKISKFQKK